MHTHISAYTPRNNKPYICMYIYCTYLYTDNNDDNNNSSKKKDK